MARQERGREALDVLPFDSLPSTALREPRATSRGSGHSTCRGGDRARHERTPRARQRPRGESNGGGGSRTRVRKACRYRNLHAYPLLVFRARRKRTAKAPGPSPRSLAGSRRTHDPASLLNGVRPQPVGWKRRTSRVFMPRVQAASSQLRCFSTGLTSTWRSACIQQSLAPVEAVSPPQGLNARCLPLF
jgi:hypothetical protein